MKVQKIVSLDENTMRISQRIPNFSKWVRKSLHAYDQDLDLVSELMLAEQQKAKWAKVARIFATTLVEKSIEIDPNFKKDVNDLIKEAIEEVQNQSSLRDFEWAMMMFTPNPAKFARDIIQVIARAIMKLVHATDAWYFEVNMMSEGSHHEYIRVGPRIIGYMRVTNSGKIISIWINDPYNQLFLPEN